MTEHKGAVSGAGTLLALLAVLAGGPAEEEEAGETGRMVGYTEVAACIAVLAAWAADRRRAGRQEEGPAK